MLPPSFHLAFHASPFVRLFVRIRPVGCFVPGKWVMLFPLSLLRLPRPLLFSFPLSYPLALPQATVLTGTDMFLVGQSVGISPQPTLLEGRAYRICLSRFGDPRRPSGPHNEQCLGFAHIACTRLSRGSGNGLVKQ